MESNRLTMDGGETIGSATITCDGLEPEVLVPIQFEETTRPPSFANHRIHMVNEGAIRCAHQSGPPVPFRRSEANQAHYMCRTRKHGSQYLFRDALVDVHQNATAEHDVISLAADDVLCYFHVGRK